MLAYFRKRLGKSLIWQKSFGTQEGFFHKNILKDLNPKNITLKLKAHVFSCFTLKLLLPNFLIQFSRKSKAVAQRCSVKKVFLEISQNSQETPVPESSF